MIRMIDMEMDVCWPPPRGWQTQPVTSYPRLPDVSVKDHWQMEADRIRTLHGVPRECASIIHEIDTRRVKRA